MAIIGVYWNIPLPEVIKFAWLYITIVDLTKLKSRMENLTKQSRLKAMIVCCESYVTVELNMLYCLFVVKIITSKELWAWLIAS